MGPWVVVGGLVLLGLGCFAQDLYGLVDGRNHSFDGEYVSATTLSSGADLAALGAIVAAAARCLLSVQNSLAIQELWPGLVGPETSYMEECKDWTARSPALNLHIWKVITLAEAVSLTAGFGYPYNGEDLKAGAEQLGSLHGQLNFAFPDNDSWRGASAQAYAGQTGALQDALQDLITLDEQLAGAAQRQADIVTHIRLALSILKALCLAAYAVTELYYIAGYDPEGGKSFDLKASVAGALGVSAIIACALAFSEDQANYAKSRAKDYHDLDNDQSVAGSVIGGLASADEVAADQTRVADFAALSIAHIPPRSGLRP